MEAIKQTKRQKKVLSGVVVSDKMDKTGVAKVETINQHPVYKRTVKQSKRYKFHDEQNSCQSGDQIRIIECKPISSEKCWRLLDIVKKAV